MNGFATFLCAKWALIIATPSVTDSDLSCAQEGVSSSFSLEVDREVLMIMQCSTADSRDRIFRRVVNTRRPVLGGDSIRYAESLTHWQRPLKTT
ncbi:hypothetical protein LY78DRAFT_239575 [Colletotrichum sublineola]|nr:hypothetical protein LY78DRAFT_239575 [Colletotrichum sublineola]